MRIIWLLLTVSYLPMTLYGQSFITVEDTHFVKDGAPYFFLGTNFWYGMNLASRGEGGDRARLLRELDRLQSLGITNLRLMAASEGPNDEPWRMKPALQTQPGRYEADLLDGLDFLLAEMGKRGLHAVVCLNNFWQWSGGMAQYCRWFGDDEIPYPDPVDGGGWLPYMRYASGFYQNEDARHAFRDFLIEIITRTNSYTETPYIEDPTIMAWQLANEPRGMLRPRQYRRWIRQTSQFIKSLDPNHLVCIGSEGNTSTPTGNHFRKDHQFSSIDYTTIHIWAQNWGWYEPENPQESLRRARNKAEKYLDEHLKVAEKLGKPLVLEEFGISRDGNDHDASAPVGYRDQYYAFIFELIHRRARAGQPAAGANFWAWGGEGRPRTPRAVWKAGDDWIGDPPHEFQGWYSVYDTDASTLAVIEKYAERMNALK